jgi:hypothetical protein
MKTMSGSISHDVKYGKYNLPLKEPTKEDLPYIEPEEVCLRDGKISPETCWSTCLGIVSLLLM